MTARPRGRWPRCRGPVASAMGTNAKKAARAVMTTGRTRIDAALRIAWSGVRPSCVRRFWAKSIEQDRVRDHDPHHEDHAQQRLHVDGRVGQVEHR